MEPNELPSQVRLAVLQGEIMEWQRLLYALEVRHRVNKRIGSPQDTLDAIAKEMERCERALDVLREMEAELEKDAT